jgi:predicted MFS family arabinose efflux permease
MFSFALVFQSIPPLLTLMREAFAISYAQAGLLMSLFALPGIIVALPGGLISDRFGMKQTGGVAALLMTVGTLIVGTSVTPFQAYAGRVVSGVGGLTLAIVLPQLLSRWFLGKELGVSMGVFNTAMPLGTIISLNGFSLVGERVGWQIPIFITTILSVIALLVFLRLFKGPPQKSTGERPHGSGDVTRLGLPIWLLGLAWMWFNATFISFVTYSSDFFVAQGYAFGSAGFMSSLVMLGSLFLSPLIGYLVYRMGRETLFIGVNGVALACLMCLVPVASSMGLLLVLISLFVAFVPAPTYSLPPKLVEPENLGLAFGIITACLNLGVLAGPYVTGWARDITGDYALSFYLLALFSICQTVTIAVFALIRQRRAKARDS